MVRPVHVVGLLLAAIPLCRYGQIEIVERRAKAADTPARWAAREDLLSRAKVFLPDAGAIGAVDFSSPAPAPELFDPGTPVTCRYVPKATSGTTTKFDCRLEDGSVIKVKYGSGPEPKAEVAATRLVTALGLPADHVSFVRRLTCDGCNVSPYRVRRLAEFYYVAPLVDMLSRSMSQTFEWVSVERKFAARPINLVWIDGWGFADLPKVDAAKGGASPAEVDALRLVATFLAHWDNKPQNQRLVCLDAATGDSGDPRCDNPLLMLQDLGATFGPTKVQIDKWKAAPIWSDVSSCHVDFTTMPYHGDGFPAVNISEEGRALLAARLGQLSEKQVSDLFAAARFPDPAAWTRVFLDRVALIAGRHCEK